MKYALSIVYGGLPISADDLRLDENSYNSLKLVCPNCRRELYFRSGSERTEHTRLLRDKEGKVKRPTKVKGAVIPPHFSHFNKNVGEVCENKVKTYTKQKIERMAAQSKGQRLKVFRYSFWRIIENNVLLLSWQENIEYGKSGFYYVYRQHKEDILDQYYQNAVNFIINEIIRTEPLVKEAIADHISSLVELAKEHDVTLVFDPLTCLGIKRVIENDFEEEMQKKIALEALEYLLSNKKNSLLRRLIQVCFASLGDVSNINAVNFLFEAWSSRLSFDDFLSQFETCKVNFKTNIQDPKKLFDIVVNRFVAILALTPWGLGFELEKQKLSTNIHNSESKGVLVRGLWHYTLTSGHNTYISYLHCTAKIKGMIKVLESTIQKKHPFFLLNVPQKTIGCIIQWNPQKEQIAFCIGEGHPDPVTNLYYEDQVYSFNQICLSQSNFDDFCEMSASFLEGGKFKKSLLKTFKAIALKAELRFPCLVSLPSKNYQKIAKDYKDMAKDEFIIAIALLLTTIKLNKITAQVKTK